MHPSANVQAQGTAECLKLQYYKIFSSNKQESGEVEEKNRDKACLSIITTWNTLLSWWAGSVWLIGTDKYTAYSEGPSGLEVKEYNPLYYGG